MMDKFPANTREYHRSWGIEYPQSYYQPANPYDRPFFPSPPNQSKSGAPASYHTHGLPIRVPQDKEVI